MSKIIIAGGRDFNDYNKLKYICDFHIKDGDEIVSGKARGADSLGEVYANEMKLNVKEFPADWNKYGKSAGYIRNEEMAKYADRLIAFWDGKSKGTKHMIDLAKKYNLIVSVIGYEKDSIS